MRRGAKLGSVLLGLVLVAGCGTDTSQGAPTESPTEDAGNRVDASGGDSGSSGACEDGETQPCYTGPSGTQGVGRCAAGTKTCVDGVFGACVGEVKPAPEVCDGVDNDCDGSADDGNPGGGQACATGLLGVCAAGTEACVSGAIICNQNVPSSAESCDGLDNDCDGTVDNGEPGAGQACQTGLLGACAAGTSSCAGGQLLCNQTVWPSSETCDSKDNDCDGTVDDGVCAPGVALHFDGVDDRVNMLVPPLFNDLSATDFTIEAWVYPTSAVFARIVFAQGSATSFAALTRNINGEAYFYVVENGTSASSSKTDAGALPLDKWTHVAGTYTTATNQVAIYINGVAQTLTPGGSSSTGTNGVMTIGSRTNGGQHFQGMIDEVRIWNVARPGCAVSSAFACELAANETGLVASYHFDQGIAGGSNPTETKLLDGTSAANHGTLSGFALGGATSNWVTAGGGVGGGLTDVVCAASSCVP